MKKFFSQMFSRDHTNTGRQIEVDLAKAICIIGMIFVHSFEALPTVSGNGGVAEFLLMRVGNTLFGATLFMFCMGIGMAYTKKNNPNQIMFRGILIFIVGLVLNFLRYTLCLLILKGAGYVVTTEKLICDTFANDILTFAGLGMFLFGLLRKIKLPGWGILIVAIGMSLVGTFCKGYDTGNVAANTFIGWFVPTITPTSKDGTTSFFALCNWFIFIVGGYCFAQYILRRVNKKGAFYLVFSSIAAIGLAIYIGICLPKKVGVFGDNFNCTYHITSVDALASLCGAVFALGVLYALSKILPNFLLTGASALSRYINTVYCVQWVFFGNMETCFNIINKDYTMATHYAALIGLGVLIISVTIAWLYKTVLPNYLQKRKEAKAA